MNQKNEITKRRGTEGTVLLVGCSPQTPEDGTVNEEVLPTEESAMAPDLNRGTEGTVLLVGCSSQMPEDGSVNEEVLPTEESAMAPDLNRLPEDVILLAGGYEPEDEVAAADLDHVPEGLLEPFPEHVLAGGYEPEDEVAVAADHPDHVPEAVNLLPHAGGDMKLIM